MSSRVDLEALDAEHEKAKAAAPRDGLLKPLTREEMRFAAMAAQSYPALRDEIKQLRLELASAKQHIRACHAVAHGTPGISYEALEESLRLAEEARKVGEGS